MSNSFNEYVKTAPTPPPPPLGLLYTENQNIKNSANLTNEQRLHFDENMERLTYILARVESLIGLAKDNPDILTECGSLMRSAADIDLPSEIKNQKLATCPAVVQEIYKRVTNDGTAQSIGQMAKQQNINMQIQQNFIDSQNEQYISQQHNMAMNALDDAISNNKPITNEIVCKHCAVMSDVTNKEKYDIKYCNQLMQRYLNAATPEERKKVLQEMKGVAKYAHKQWKTREKWHKTTRSSLASGKLTPEQLKEFDESLRKEEETAKQMLKQAQELRQLAENETDPQKRKELLGMASEIERGATVILKENQATRQEYNRCIGKVSTRTNTATIKQTSPKNQNEIHTVQKQIQNQWETRKQWHKTTRGALASGELTPEQIQESDESLRKEEETAKQMLKQAQELRQLAENETDPQKRKELLGMASEIERGATVILKENQATRQEYDIQTVDNKDTEQTNVSAPNKITNNNQEVPYLPKNSISSKLKGVAQQVVLDENQEEVNNNVQNNIYTHNEI